MDQRGVQEFYIIRNGKYSPKIQKRNYFIGIDIDRHITSHGFLQPDQVTGYEKKWYALFFSLFILYSFMPAYLMTGETVGLFAGIEWEKLMNIIYTTQYLILPLFSIFLYFLNKSLFSKRVPIIISLFCTFLLFVVILTPYKIFGESVILYYIIFFLFNFQ